MKAKPLPIYSVFTKGHAHEIHADGKSLKTPAGFTLEVPMAGLAQAMLEEWRTQGKIVNPVTMPLTQLACTAIDIAGKERRAMIDQLLHYTGSELLCHRADDPPMLAKQQQDIWQPILDWCEQKFKAVLKNGIGIMPITQTPEAVANLRRAVEHYDGFYLTGLRHAADISGSLVLALALAERRLNAEQVVHAAELDAGFQMQKWGEDPASISRREAMKRDLFICAQWFELLRTPH